MGSEWEWAWASVPRDRGGWVWAVWVGWLVAAWPWTGLVLLSAWALHGLLVAAARVSGPARVALAAGLRWMSKRRVVNGMHLVWLVGWRSLIHTIFTHARKEDLPAFMKADVIGSWFNFKGCYVNDVHFWVYRYESRHGRGFLSFVAALVLGSGPCTLCDLRYTDTKQLRRLQAKKVDELLRPLSLPPTLDREETELLLMWKEHLWEVYWSLQTGGSVAEKVARFQEDLGILESKQGLLPVGVAQEMIDLLPRLLEPGWGTPHFHRFVHFILRLLQTEEDVARMNNWPDAIHAVFWNEPLEMSGGQLEAFLHVLPSLIRRLPSLVKSLIGVPLLRAQLGTQPELRAAIIWALRHEEKAIERAWRWLSRPPLGVGEVELWVGEGLGALWLHHLRTAADARGGRVNVETLRRHMRMVLEFVGEGAGSGLRALLYRSSSAPALLHSFQSRHLGRYTNVKIATFFSFINRVPPPPSSLSAPLRENNPLVFNVY